MTDPGDYWWNQRVADAEYAAAQDRVTALEQELRHARAIALCSVGQPDRAENVAHRESVRAALAAARTVVEEWFSEPKK